MKTLNFVIPVYNEADRLQKTLTGLTRDFKNKDVQLKKIIFVDDGSSDHTVKLLQKNKQKLQETLKTKVVIISYKQNKGKGYAIRTGMLASNADYTLFFDADMSTPLSEFTKFVPFMTLGFDVIIGTRKNGKSTVIKPQPIYRQILGRGFTLLSQLILGTWVTDFTCGFKAFSKDALQNIFTHTHIDRWGYDAELLFLANKLGYSIKEVPVTWQNDDRSKVNILYDLPKSLSELLEVRWNDMSGKYDNAIRKASRLSIPDISFNKIYNG